MSAIAIIPARGGSRRIPRKNIRMFHGKPIIAYSIEAAWAAGIFDKVIVTTEDEEIGEVASEYGAIWHMRVQELARDEVGTLAVTADVARAYSSAEYVCTIYATAPMLRPADICRGFESLKSYRACHVVSVTDSPLRDAAQFYWSLGSSARAEDPYWEYLTVGEFIDPKRVCDINVEDDWRMAERMYAEQHGIEVAA